MIAVPLSPSSTKVKFRLAGGAQPLILLPVRVNDRGPFDFILDTGAGTSLLSPEVAKELGIEIIGSKEGQSAGGKVAVALGRADSLAVGDLWIDDVDLGIVDLAHVGKTIGAKIDGDLGYNFLKHFRVTLNYRDCEIGFDDPNRVESFGRRAKTEVPIRLAGPAKPLILLDVHANGRGPFQFALDTGTSTTAIAPLVAKQLGISGLPIGAGTTAGAQVDVRAAKIQFFQVGGARINDMPVVVADFFQTLSSAAGAQLDGIVGYNFLRNYTVAIDYPNGVLTLF